MSLQMPSLVKKSSLFHLAGCRFVWCTATKTSWVALATSAERTGIAQQLGIAWNSSNLFCLK